MESDDTSKDTIDLETYLPTWKALGFDAPSFQEGAAQLKPSEFADLQRTVESAQLLKARMKPFTSSICLLYTSPSPRDPTKSRMPSSA